jgi:hypothetical protein
LTNIYAPCQDAEQLIFLDWLHHVDIPPEENCLLVGDFNLLRSPQDRNKPGGNINEMLLFNEAISNAGLVEIPLKGRRIVHSCKGLTGFFPPWLGRKTFLTLWQPH